MIISRDLCDIIAADIENQGSVMEAFGTPGVGKSYFCLNFRDRYSAEYGKINYHSIDGYNSNFYYRLFKKIIIILKGVTFSPRILRLNILIIMRFKKIHLTHKFKLLLNLLLISSVIFNHRECIKPLLLDQGIFQALWSCCYYNNKEDMIISSDLISLISCLLDNLLIKNLYVFDITSKKKTIAARLVNRQIKGTSPLNSLNESDISRGINATILTRNLMLNLAQNSDKVKVFDVKN